MHGFKMAAGSVPGTDHTKPGHPGWKNNQDAHDFQTRDDFLVAVVCDGCGGAENGYSELGARLGARLVAKAAAEVLALEPRLQDHPDRLLAEIAERVSDTLRMIAGMGTLNRLGRDSFTASHLLFTIIGVIITEERTLVFSFGDGVYAVNGEVTVIPPFPENKPPYIAYRFLPSDVDPALLRFNTRAFLPTAEVQSVLIGSDGVADFIEAAEMPLPMLGTPVGPLSQFWEDDRFVKNPDMIRRRLALANREHVDGGLIKGGLLPDDTTLLVVRRT